MATALTTVARPYAKAAFEYALQDKALDQWSMLLRVLAAISVDEQVAPLLTDPRFSATQRYEFFSEVAKQWLDEHSRNFVNLLARNRRLAVLPEIAVLYESYRSEHEKTVEVLVTSFLPLSTEQIQRLSKTLKQRLQSDVTLNCQVDKKLLGGAIVRAGDLVIDGSVLGQLDKMRRHLAA